MLPDNLVSFLNNGFLTRSFQYNAGYHCVKFPTSMPRLQCFCEFAQCGGTLVDSKTFHRHKRHDSSKRARDAFDTAMTACKKQDDDIAAHLASLSLPYDRPTNLPIPLHQSTTANTTSPLSTEKKLVRDLLYRLRDIEASLEDLTLSVNGKLNCIGNPGAANEAFPLLSFISTARSIQSRLSGITSRAAPVQETKSSIRARLDEVVTKLAAAKHSWNSQAKNLPIRADFHTETTFSTGRLKVH